MAGDARDLRLPTLDGLRAVDAAERLGSFERAGAALHITASAVAKRVAAVEDLLGTTLFVRGGAGLQPTPACLDYLPPVRAALALLAQMPQHQRPQVRARRLRISAPPTFARLVLVPALDDFARLHPGIDIEVVLSIPFLDNPAVSAAQADVAVRHGDAAALGGTVLMHDVVLPVAAPPRRRPRGCCSHGCEHPHHWWREPGRPGEPAAGRGGVGLGLSGAPRHCGVDGQLAGSGAARRL